MMNIDATFEVVKARQADLRLLAGPQPMVPLFGPPFDSLRQRISRLLAHLGEVPATSGPPPAPANPRVSGP